jgi:hypothetical protein
VKKAEGEKTMKTKKENFLAFAALTLVVIAVVGLIGLAFSSAQAATGAAPIEALQNAPMQELTEAQCTPNGSTLSCDLWAKAGTLEILPGINIPVWGFSDSETGPALVPGPIIRVALGQSLEIVLHNALDGQAVSMAFPGQDDIIPDLDGVTSGGTKTYTFIPDHAGSFIYEAGLTSDGARQVAMGLAGPLIVEDGTEPGNQEIVLVFSEVDPAFNANPTTYSMLNFQTKYWLINGKSFPNTGEIAVQAGSTVLFRLINMGVETHPIGILGLSQQVIAADGTTTERPYWVNTAPLSSGQTKDTRVEIPFAQNGTLFPLYDTGLFQHNNNQRIGRLTAFGGMLAFLTVEGNGEPSALGPVASNVAVTPAKTDGDVPVTLSATLTDADANVVASEYFIDVLGAAGTGTAIDVPTPAFSVGVSTSITTDILAGLSGGQHTFYVRGQDELGNWGTAGSAVLTLDKAGPTILGLALAPNPTNGERDVLLSGTADDRANGNSIVVSAEFRIDNGAWQPMILSPLNSPLTGLSATLDAAIVAGLSEGIHPVEVRAQDEFENWTDPVATTDLRVDKTGPNVTAASLTPNLIDLSKPLPTSVRLNASLTDPLSGGTQSILVTAEGFIDVVGAPGTGFSLYPSDGLFDEVSEDAYFNIPGSYFATLTPGTHQVLVVGKDKAGNWGPAGSATIEIVAQVSDTTGPTVTNVVATPNPTAGANNVLLTATATDTQSNIAGAVWFVGTTPPKKLNYMTASDGSFDSLSENVKATINVKTWKVGVYPISVRPTMPPVSGVVSKPSILR